MFKYWPRDYLSRNVLTHTQKIDMLDCKFNISTIGIEQYAEIVGKKSFILTCQLITNCISRLQSNLNLNVDLEIF